MLDTASQTRDTSGRQGFLVPATSHQEAARTIVQAICLGRSIVGIVASASTRRSVLDAVLADLASRQTRVILACKTATACMGLASSMDWLKASRISGKGTVSERSRQIAECLQFFEVPVFGETRRILVIEDAEEVDPRLLEDLARMPALDQPNLPLQLLYVGTTKYWDNLLACGEGAARRRIGAPIILLQATEESTPYKPDRLAAGTDVFASFPRPTPTRRRVSRPVVAALAVLGCGSLLAAGVTNQASLVAFIKSHSIRLEEGINVSAFPFRVTMLAERGSQPGSSHPASFGVKAGEKPMIVSLGEAEGVAHSEISPAKIPDASATMLPATDHGVLLPNVEPPSAAREAAPDHASVVRLVSTALSRGEAMLAIHDLSAARRYYELAANAGSASGALALGRTYDPTSLVRSEAVSAQPDGTLAVLWYRKAVALGSNDAERSLRNLERQQKN